MGQEAFGNTVSISEKEWRSLPRLSPQGEYEVKQTIWNKLGKKENPHQNQHRAMDDNG